MRTNENIKYVGTLQDLGRPYSMLFVNKENRQLYFLVRLSDDKKENFLVVNVSPNEVKSYMEEHIGMLNIMNEKIHYIASLRNNQIYFEDEILQDFTPTEHMKKMNIFDPELCDDDVWLEVFLNRITNNQPLEIA